MSFVISGKGNHPVNGLENASNVKGKNICHPQNPQIRREFIRIHCRETKGEDPERERCCKRLGILQ